MGRGPQIVGSASSLRIFRALFSTRGAKLSPMNQQQSNVLFAGMSAEEVAGVAAVALEAEPRLRTADRSQFLLRPCCLEDLLPLDHEARAVWEMVCSWDLTRFLATISARGSRPGRAATDPKILIALWVYAHTQGVGSARELDRLCEHHDAYRWLCGGVSLNYHTLSDFRVEHEQALDQLLTQMLAVLIHAGVVSVWRISQDGTRQRCGAGRNSFKTEATLQEQLKQAQEHVQILKAQAQDPNVSLQRQKAIERAAREKVQRLQKALVQVQKVAAAKQQQKEKPSKHTPATASSTDPEARKMKMPDGGTAPAYNVQFGVDTQSRAIVGVEVTNAGNDVEQSKPLREQVEDRTGQKVHEHLVDGGFIGLEAVDAAAAANTTLYAPVPKPRKEGVDRYQPKSSDTAAQSEWRQRMGTPQAQAIYQERCSTSETVNGECKSYRGLGPLLVRGTGKVRCVALWAALAYNFVHFGRQLIG